MVERLEDICARTVRYNGDLLRNIPGIRKSQDLFDDLAESVGDRAIAIQAAALGHIETAEALVTRPFDYGAAVTYSFDTSPWQATRYSDGTRFGIWYGSPELETTVHETVFHWRRFIMDSFPDHDRPIIGERRVFKAACHALLIDLRGMEGEHPDLVSRTSYAFTQALGAWLHDQGQNGLLVRSARCQGTNAAILNPDRLTGVRDFCFLTYSFLPGSDLVTVERQPGTAWLTIAPSSLV